MKELYPLKNTNHYERFGRRGTLTDLLYLVCSVNRPFNDGERNSRSIIIPNRLPFLKQLCSKVTAAITAGSGCERNALQTGLICGKRSVGVTQVLPECTDVQYVLLVFAVSSVEKNNVWKTKSHAPFTSQFLFFTY